MRKRAVEGTLLVALMILVSACTPTAAKIIVVTATPRPSPAPRATARPSSVAVARPPATPTRQAGGIQLTGVQVETGNLMPGDTATLDYTIDNGTGVAQDVTLGATIYSDQESQSLSDPSHDTTVTALPGSQVHSRQFFLPMATAGQSFDLLASVDAPSFTHVYAEKRFSQLLTVAGREPLAPSSTENPPPQGGVMDPNTGMQATVSDVQSAPSGDPALPGGYGLVVFYVRLANSSAAPHDYNSLDFTCVDDNDTAHLSDSMLAALYNAAQLNWGTMAPADARAGWDGCEVPANTKLRIVWDDASLLQPPVQVWPSA